MDEEDEVLLVVEEVLLVPIVEEEVVLDGVVTVEDTVLVVSMDGAVLKTVAKVGAGV